MTTPANTEKPTSREWISFVAAMPTQPRILTKVKPRPANRWQQIALAKKASIGNKTAGYIAKASVRPAKTVRDRVHLRSL